MVNIGGELPRGIHFNTAGYGEPGHYFALHPKPTNEFPLRAVVSFPCGRAIFDSPDDALEYLEHPGDIQHAARHYLAEHASLSDRQENDHG